jgi:hypothetical protein
MEEVAVRDEAVGVSLLRRRGEDERAVDVLLTDSGSGY